MRVVDLRQKEVINICTCKTLGCPIDVEFNPKTGEKAALINGYENRIPIPAESSSILHP